VDPHPPIIFRPRLFHEILYDSYASLEKDKRLQKKDGSEKHTHLSSK
jgi:hypothetical protein